MNALEMNEVNTLPGKYRPLSPWAYFGYTLLFAIPLVGFICLLIFSFSNENINRRNYARSYFCILIVILVVALVIVAIGGGLNAILALLAGSNG